MPTLQPKELEFRDYSWEEIKSATKRFTYKICDGGFGPIYKGFLPCGTPIAVKELSTDSKLGKQEFENEVDKLHNLDDHPNIVKLLGFWKEKKTKLFPRKKKKFLLVFKFMDNGSLRSALFGQQQKFLERRKWPYRFKMILGLAKGLAHLHDIAKIVHGDITLSNILLDDKWNPKISDFGFAKRYEGREETHSSSGTMECTGPECSRRGLLTETEDTHNFGIVTLELMSGRLHKSRPQNDQNESLLELANRLKKRGDLLALVDTHLKMTIPVDKATMVLELALLCTNTSIELRPSMSEVVKHLEGGEPLTKHYQFQPNNVRSGAPEMTTTDIPDNCLGNTSGEKEATHHVTSENNNSIEQGNNNFLGAHPGNFVSCGVQGSTSKEGDDYVGGQANFADLSKPANPNAMLQSLTVSKVGAKGEGEVEYFKPIFLHGIHRIECLDEELEARRRKLESSLVGHFLDQSESLNIDIEMIENLWKVQETFTVISVGNGYFLFRFNSTDEKFRILESPDLWQIGPRRLVLVEWNKRLKFDKPPGMKSLPVWVKIYNLPFSCWSTPTLCKVVSGFGVPLYVDRKTKKQCGEYAKLLIQFDACKPLPQVWELINKKEVYQLVLEYYWRPLRCTACCTFGHKSESCSNSM